MKFTTIKYLFRIPGK